MKVNPLIFLKRERYLESYLQKKRPVSKDLPNELRYTRQRP